MVALHENVEYRHWVHGHTYWEPMTPHSIRYVCKYIAKEVETEDRQYHKAQSRMPPLGDAYFRLLAKKYIEDRLAPQDFLYSFAGVEHKGKQKRFVMRGKTRDNFLRYFHEGWWATYGDHPPNSEILDEWEDAQVKQGSQDEAKRDLAAEKVGLVKLRDHGIDNVSTLPVHKPKDHDLRSWMDPQRLHFSETLNVWLYEFDGEQRPWYWAMDENREWGWRSKIGAGAKNDLTPSYRQASRGR